MHSPRRAHRTQLLPFSLRTLHQPAAARTLRTRSRQTRAPTGRVATSSRPSSRAHPSRARSPAAAAPKGRHAQAPRRRRTRAGKSQPAATSSWATPSWLGHMTAARDSADPRSRRVGTHLPTHTHTHTQVHTHASDWATWRIDARPRASVESSSCPLGRINMFANICRALGHKSGSGPSPLRRART